MRYYAFRGHLLSCRAPSSLGYWEEHAACWSPSHASHHAAWHCCLSPAHESLCAGYCVMLGCWAVPGGRCPRAWRDNGLYGSQHMLCHYVPSSTAAWLWATSCRGTQHTHHATLGMCRYNQILISPISITVAANGANKVPDNSRGLFNWPVKKRSLS